MQRNKAIIVLISLLIIFAGCSSNSPLLESAINPDEITSIQFAQAMGNPTYGADSKTITERGEIETLVAAFNGAVVAGEVARDNLGIGFHSTIVFFSGDVIVHQFFFNVNNTEAVLLDSRFHYVEYPGMTPFELYRQSSAEVIVVDEDLIQMVRPTR